MGATRKYFRWRGGGGNKKIHQQQKKDFTYSNKPITQISKTKKLGGRGCKKRGSQKIIIRQVYRPIVIAQSLSSTPVKCEHVCNLLLLLFYPVFFYEIFFFFMCCSIINRRRNENMTRENKNYVNGGFFFSFLKRHVCMIAS